MWHAITSESADSSDSDGGEDEDGDGKQSVDLRQESSDEDDALPVYLYTPQTTDKMGDWEKHTKVTRELFQHP